jgi:hypothetical protein
VTERSATAARRESLLKEHGKTSSELQKAYKLRLDLKGLGQTKVRAILERGKIPQVNEQEIRQKLRELELSRKRDKGLGLSR